MDSILSLRQMYSSIYFIIAIKFGKASKIPNQMR